MIDQELLNILACPETKQDLELASSDLIQKINELIEKGQLSNRGGQKLDKKIEGGLIQKVDRKYLYPIREEIPIMLIEESIPLDSLK